MLVPLEIALLFAATGVWLVRDALHGEESAPKRAAMTLSAVGAMMVAVGGRLPVPSAGAGFSFFVTAGALVVVAGMVTSILLTVAAFARQRRVRRGPAMPDR